MSISHRPVPGLGLRGLRVRSRERGQDRRGDEGKGDGTGLVGETGKNDFRSSVQTLRFVF